MNEIYLYKIRRYYETDDGGGSGFGISKGHYDTYYSKKPFPEHIEKYKEIVDQIEYTKIKVFKNQDKYYVQSNGNFNRLWDIYESFEELEPEDLIRHWD